MFSVMLDGVPYTCLADLEQIFVDVDRADGLRPYNIRPTAGSNLGFHHSAESGLKMSKSRTGKVYGKYPKWRVEKMRASLIGRKSPNKGVPMSLEQRARLSLVKTGVKVGPMSDEQKALLSLRHTGLPTWNKGKKMPDSFCAKVSAGRRLAARAMKSNPDYLPKRVRRGSPTARRMEREARGVQGEHKA